VIIISDLELLFHEEKFLGA